MRDFEDFDRYDRECANDEKYYPVCDICGERITDDYYYEVAGMKFHLECADCHSVESYVEGQKYGY